MNHSITVVVPVHNEKKYVEQCITHILQQTIRDFELIVSDDGSDDGTQKIVQSFADPRISYIRNERQMGVSATRNQAIQRARGEYIFFTDGDCLVEPDWLEQGLKVFAQHDCVGVEGKLFFVAQDYHPVYSDRVVQNLHGSVYMTANMAYRRDVLLQAGLFDPALKRHQDLDLALRVKRFGEIVFAPEMIVRHAHTKWTPQSYFRLAKAAYSVAHLYKRHAGRVPQLSISHRIYAPEKILAILFPPSVLLTLFLYRYKTIDDYVLFLLMYPRLVYERILLWRACWAEKVFLV